MIDKFWSLNKLRLQNWLAINSFSDSHLKPLIKYNYSIDDYFFSNFSNNNHQFPKNLLTKFTDNFTRSKIKINHYLISPSDLSIKFVIDLEDNNQIEMVILTEKRRLTLCLSTQVGCKQKCTFCATGRMGLIRNLQVDEIVGQIMIAKKWLNNPDHHWLKKRKLLKKLNPLSCTESLNINNLVFMGMGEPLDNLNNLSKALEIILDPLILNFSKRKVTLSTAGQLDGLRKIYQRFPQINYAISLHSPFQTLRSSLMPINKRYPLDTLIDFLAEKSSQHHKVFFIEYTLINNVNDSKNHALQLIKLLSKVKVKINLLNFNEIDGSFYKICPADKTRDFAKILYNHGLFVTTRFSKSKDISGACGQLITTNQI